MTYLSRLIPLRRLQGLPEDVEVDLVQNVSWNKQTFKNLVMNEEGKELIYALVTDSTGSKQSAGSLRGESSRLTILLHGAESIAEQVQTPLIRVNCNKISNKPLRLQHEADDFLEQRTAAFLRVLKNHVGIVNITTSRLRFHHETLDISQRRRTWVNLLDLSHRDLPKQNNNKAQPAAGHNKRIDLDSIKRHVHELAEEEMNGHQIRNAITAAVQIARYKDERMTYRHLGRVIKSPQRFHKSLGKARGDGADERLSCTR
ncbi:uncharacterized protein LY79DRAFT_587571 [Colletotrichum navitas]|uniref:Uncharacterized protein n=1 Tax=Colletotrichum navitas TaxID=681940 RepID=A0AAD8Q8U3_9PEZI|nr:uncharacterized protein LY79DRAFT_587571 [Colletotrichum navitas]KAK1597102.1 hypothetical protein LY79DRAFT_587571 [Colletotrichum navitas]